MRPKKQNLAVLCTLFTLPFVTTSAPIPNPLPEPIFHLPQPNTLQPNHDKYNHNTRPDRVAAMEALKAKAASKAAPPNPPGWGEVKVEVEVVTEAAPAAESESESSGPEVAHPALPSDESHAAQPGVPSSPQVETLDTSSPPSDAHSSTADDHHTTAPLSAPIPTPPSPPPSPYDLPPPRQHRLSKPAISVLIGAALLALTLLYITKTPQKHFAKGHRVKMKPSGDFTWWEKHFWGNRRVEEVFWTGPPLEEPCVPHAYLPGVYRWDV